MCWLVMGAAPHGQDAPLFRIFLRDGEPLVSYGEFARVADRVVFSVPIGDHAAEPLLQMVSIPAAAVDWTRTDDYANAVRAQRYAETRGEEDFALLASRVTSALNDIRLTSDPRRALAMAEEARRNLAAWPAANFGYGAADVARLVSMLDDVVIELRTAAGQGPFELSLMATTLEPPAPVALLPPPDAQTSLESAYQAARLSAEPSERIALLRRLTGSLANAPASAWTAGLRARISAALDDELKVERAYADLARTSLRAAEQRASRGDVRGLQQVIQRALAGDDRLGRRRAGEMSALLAALDLRLDEAHRVRVARDAWARRVEVFKAYRSATATVRGAIDDLARPLHEVRDRKPGTPRALQHLEIRATLALYELRVVEVPAELAGAHGLMVTSLQLAQQAASLARAAVSAKNTTLAWDASSAAAGALLLAQRADEALREMINGRW